MSEVVEGSAGLAVDNGVEFDGACGVGGCGGVCDLVEELIRCLRAPLIMGLLARSANAKCRWNPGLQDVDVA